jgi:uncharacterized protein YciI
MHVALIAIDKSGALDLRKSNRDAHLAYADAQGCTFVAGPLLDDAGDMVGSLVVLDVPDMAAAEDWAANDPYAKAGLFESVTLRAWKKVRG